MTNASKLLLLFVSVSLFFGASISFDEISNGIAAIGLFIVAVIIFMVPTKAKNMQTE